MSFGRVSGTSPFSRAPPTRVKPRNIFIICEGATELDYFQALKDKKQYKDCIEVNPVDKIGPDRDDSDRLSIIQLAYEYQNFQKDGRLPLRLFMSMSIQIFINNFKFKSYSEFKMDVKDLSTYLRTHVRDAYYDSYQKSEYVDQGFVINPKDLACEIIKDCNVELGKDINYFKAEEDSLLFPKSLMDPLCKSYVIFDRDYDEDFNRGDEDYNIWLRECERTGVNPVITSPCFELWLYMHWANTDYGSPSHMPEYGKEIKRKVLKSEHPEWSASDIEYHIEYKKDKRLYDRSKTNRFNMFYFDKINRAIQESKSYPDIFYTDSVNLNDHPGTMIGIFLEELLR